MLYLEQELQLISKRLEFTITASKRHLDGYSDCKGLDGYGANGTSLEGVSWSAWINWAESLFRCCMTNLANETLYILSSAMKSVSQ